MATSIAGTASFKIDGDVYNIVGDITYSTAPESAESQVGVDGHFGVNYTPMACFFEGQFRDSEDLEISDLQKLSGVTVQLSLRNGKEVIFPDATQMLQPEVNPIDGTYRLRFECQRAEEVTA